MISRLRKLNKIAKLDIQQGDLVDFGPYGKNYVCDPDYSDEYYWITDEPNDRMNPNAEGWSIKKDRAIKIIEEN